jgi:hypothetical protein
VSRWLFRGGITSCFIATFLIGWDPWDEVEFAGKKETFSLG